MAVALLSLQSTHAAESQKNVVVMGFGTATWALFANIYKDNPERTEINFFAWAQGYMSGWNRAQMKQGQPTINLALLQTQKRNETSSCTIAISTPSHTTSRPCGIRQKRCSYLRQSHCRLAFPIFCTSIGFSVPAVALRRVTCVG
jgi:hypothetical protein